MDCHEAASVVYLYLDGEVRAWRRLVIRRHLRRCPPCGEAFEFELVLRERVRESCCETPPAGLADRIRQSLLDDRDD
jgi:mycothiol system anti-sigma-R factor